ncbi:MAG: D-aminoacyl-tRNA deacylase, partial [Candidatus Micrarchaeota archaeon]
PKKVAFQHLASHPLEGFEAVMECTHHGPTSMKTPFFFIEIGSTEKEWVNEKAGEIVADAIMKSVEPELPKFRIAMGAGGTHYCPSFTKFEIETDLAFAHIIPNYAADSIEEETFQQGVEKSKTKLLVLDWKGLKGSQREKIIGFAKNSGLEITSDKELRKN